MRLGITIECDGKAYDILETPNEIFLQLIPGLSEHRLKQIEFLFADFWPDSTHRRCRILDFVATQSGLPVEELYLNRELIKFDELDIATYIDMHTKQGSRPS